MEEVVLPAGTFVILETADRLPSDRAQRGQVVNLRVRTNVVAGGQVVVKSGALALGHVVEVGKNFNYNDPAYIVIAAEQVQAVDGQMLRLNGFPATVSGSEPRTIVLLEPMQMLTASVMNNETIIVKN